MAYSKMEVKNSVLKQGVHYLTSDYKSRNKNRPSHNGIDMIGKSYACDYIVAIEKGTVREAGYNSYYGYYAVIQHTNDYYSRYYHMKKGSLTVKNGDVVVKGQILGYMGSTGSSTGAHLHFGMQKGSTYIDPLPFLNGTNNFENDTKPTTTDVEYQAYDNDRKEWLGIIKNYNETNSNGYAGWTGHDIGGLKVRLTDGSKITIKSHILGGNWLGEITKWDNTNEGYSGIRGYCIDKVMIKAEKHKIKYRVYVKDKGWLNWITDFDPNKSTGFAGWTGYEIQKIQIGILE